VVRSTKVELVNWMVSFEHPLVDTKSTKGAGAMVITLLMVSAQVFAVATIRLTV